jgi:rSAM/selenodomain-associated transferase 2
MSASSLPRPFEALSIIVPVRNEREALPKLLDDLRPFVDAGAELIVADGGSDDGSDRLAGTHLLCAPRGRARQQNAGAAHARGAVLWFVHADSQIGEPLQAAWRELLGREDWVWGRFDVALDARGREFRLIETMINLRSRLSGIATGDQGLFVRADCFRAIGGFPDQPLMEDVELSKRLKKQARPECRRERIMTSARRWLTRGVWRTVLLMWELRLRYFLGADPHALAARYR